MNFPGCGFNLFAASTLSLPPNYLVASSLLRTTQDAEATPYGDNHYNPTDVIIQMYKKNSRHLSSFNIFRLLGSRILTRSFLTIRVFETVST